MYQAIFPQPGSAQNPKDFVGRVDISERATRLLARRVHLRLTDPRRMGKTYWLKTFCDRTTDFDPVIIDYEGVSTREEFLTRTASALAAHRDWRTRLLSTLDHVYAALPEFGIGEVSLKPAARTTSPVLLLEETIGAIEAMADRDRPLLICLDEFPLAIANIARSESGQAALEVLQILRRLRQTGSQIRWIIAGSIGFHHVLRLIGGTEGDINDLESLPLGPLPPEEATELVERLMIGIERPATDQAVARLVSLSGGIPFLLHQLAMAMEQGDGPVEAVEVQQRFDDFIADRDASRAATHLITRLEPYYDDLVDQAEAILDRVALNPGCGLSDLPGEPTALNEVLDLLIDDHYLIEDQSGCYQWKYEVLKKIWIHRRRLGRAG